VAPKTRQVNLRMPGELVDAIDGVRGTMPRDRLLRAMATRWFAFHQHDTVEVAALYVQEAEQGFTLDAGVLRMLDDAVVVTDLTFRVRLWNRGAERTFGWSEAEALGRNAFERMPSAFTRQQSQRAVDAIVRDGYWRSQGTWFAKGGTPVNAELVAQSVTDPSGEVRGLVGVYRQL
jgi:PAS domain S-box-containing protein